MKSPLALLRELRVQRQVETSAEHSLGPREDLDCPRPVCVTCGEAISGEGVTILWGGPHHEACAPHGEATAS